MKIFATGATGFIGLNIVEALLAAGHEVHAYVRPAAKRRFLDRFRVDCHIGELGDIETMETAMRGCDAVIHTAGNTSVNGKDWDALIAANVTSTASVLEAARRTGIRRMVYTSTTSTVGARNDRRACSGENARLDGFRAGSPYGRSKLMAENLVLAANNEDLETIVLNPAEVIGRYDHNLQWGRMVLAAAAGQVPFIPTGSGSFCAARDVAAAHVAALTSGQPGQRYILAGHNLGLSEVIGMMGQAAGRSVVAPLDRSPYRWQVMRAMLQEKGWLRSRGPTALEAYRMRVFGGHYFFGSRKAADDLGYSPGPIAGAIAECYAWYRENGFIDRCSAELPENPPIRTIQ
ncbi:MAG: NAD-dependent epimerase/dehydratase family protein [Burkholderiales bacterium]